MWLAGVWINTSANPDGLIFDMHPDPITSGPSAVNTLVLRSPQSPGLFAVFRKGCSPLHPQRPLSSPPRGRQRAPVPTY